MPACCTPFERVADQQFNRETAAAELKRYHRKGPGATTRLLADGIAQADALGSTLLDIGSGIGALTFALLARGVAHATAIDASSACIELGRQEAARLGRADVVQFLHADFVSVASELPVANAVALDRVVCCYPSYEPLLDAALRHTDRCLALSYPRDTWYVHAATRIENSQRWLMRNAFRTFVHPSERIEQMIRRAGFTLNSRRETWIWSVDVYTR
jgi:cyclopropane fatty-acyl-phospholipid synthase-like methyltransferase